MESERVIEAGQFGGAMWPIRRIKHCVATGGLRATLWNRRQGHSCPERSPPDCGGACPQPGRLRRAALLTRDHRAVRTYELLKVTYELVN